MTKNVVGNYFDLYIKALLLKKVPCKTVENISYVYLDPPHHIQCESPSKKRGVTYTYFIRVGGKLTFFVVSNKCKN
jgi:hypothetical protein